MILKKKYRICIETEKSGKKHYSAQESHILGFWFGWRCIKSDGFSYDSYWSSVEKFADIKGAEEAINTRLEVIKQEDSEKIISIDYKHI